MYLVCVGNQAKMTRFDLIVYVVISLVSDALLGYSNGVSRRCDLYLD